MGICILQLVHLKPLEDDLLIWYDDPLACIMLLNNLAYKLAHSLMPFLKRNVGGIKLGLTGLPFHQSLHLEFALYFFKLIL